MRDLGSRALRRWGSSPHTRTTGEGSVLGQISLLKTNLGLEPRGHLAKRRGRFATRGDLRRSGGQVPSPAPRRRGLRILRDGVFFFKTNVISHSLRRSSFPNRTRFAGLRFGGFCLSLLSFLANNGSRLLTAAVFISEWDLNGSGSSGAGSTLELKNKNPMLRFLTLCVLIE